MRTVYSIGEALKIKAAKVCRHADPRCIDDPCPNGIWRVLCDPNTRAQENQHD